MGVTLALIAGQGGLPPYLAAALLARGEVPLICEIEQFPSDITGDALPRLSFRLETLGTFLAALKDKGITQICMAGAMRRPDVEPGLIDAETLPLVPRVQAALAQGDDGTLRIFVEMFEECGLEVIGAATIAPELLPAEGVLTGLPPKTLDAECAIARLTIAEMAACDEGQAVLVCDGQVIAKEDARGTDAMLADFAPTDSAPWLASDPFDLAADVLDAAADWLSGPGAPPRGDHRSATGAVLYKAPKPGQELRVDMPLIGLQTVLKAAQAGLSGIVIEAGGVMLLNRDQVLQALRQGNMFLWVCPPATQSADGPVP